MPWIEPGPTPAGLIQLEGISPRPTEAPGSNGLPHELLKRAIIFPPPANYCGFISGIYSELDFSSEVLIYLTQYG